MLVYRREIHAHIRSLLIWCAVIILLIFGGMGKYEAGFASGGTSMSDIFDTLPDSLKRLFGIGVLDPSRAIEYYAILFLYINLMLSLQACMGASSIISKEERDRTSEFLLVKPITRCRILSEKLLASLTISFIILIVTYGFSALSLLRFSPWEGFSRELFLLIASGFILQLIFLSVGAFFAAALNRPKLAVVLASGTLLAMYFTSMIIDLFEELAFLKYLTCFKYFDPKDILISGHWGGYFILSFLLIILLVSGAYYSYQKRDMKI